jgi:hypothetical protein
MKRTTMKKLAKAAVTMKCAAQDRKIRLWTGQVGRGAALLLAQRRLRKAM